MFKGLLTVDGTIDTQQFWPNGRSDADTVKVSVHANSFQFTPDPKTTKAKVTKVFTGAQIESRGKPTPAMRISRTEPSPCLPYTSASGTTII